MAVLYIFAEIIIANNNRPNDPVFNKDIKKKTIGSGDGFVGVLVCSTLL